MRKILLTMPIFTIYKKKKIIMKFHECAINKTLPKTQTNIITIINNIIQKCVKDTYKNI